MPYRDRLGPVDFKDSANGLVGTITPGFYMSTVQDSEEETFSALLGGQSFFMKDRLIVTYGFRRDTLDQRIALQPTDPVTGAITSTELADPERYTGDTKTAGAVFHLTHWISLFGNVADNFQPQSALSVFDTNIGNKKSKGRDIGVKANLFDNRLYFTGSYYETKSDNIQTSNASEYPGPINTIWSAVDPARDVDLKYADTSAYDASGYEFEMVANLANGLSLSSNLGIARCETSDVNPRTVAYVAEHRDLWLSKGSLVPPGQSRTVAQIVAEIDEFLAQERLQEGVSPLGNVKMTFNAFVKYQFKSGPLKGFNAALGGKYRGKAIIGYTTDRKEILAPSYWLSDLKLGYTRKLNARMNATVRLNVQNLFDNGDLVWLRAATNGRLTHYRFQNPRQISLTTELSF